MLFDDENDSIKIKDDDCKEYFDEMIL